MRRRALFIALGTCLVSLLAVPGFGQSAQSQGKVTLEYWTIFTGPDGKFMQKIVDNFNKANSGKIKVNLSVIPAADYYVKLPVAVAGGKGPDVGIVHLDQLKRVEKQGLLVPLPDPAADLGLKDGDILASAWEAGKVGDKHYALPLDVHPLVLYWNKKLFQAAGLDPEKPPKNRQEFLEYARKLTKEAVGGKSGQWGTAISVGWPNFQLWYSIFYSNGGDLFSADLKKSTYGGPEGLDAAQFLVDLSTKEKVAPANVQIDADVDMFKRGTIGMEFNGIWMLDAYKNTAGLSFGAAPIPQLGSQKPAEWAGSHNLVVFKQKSKNADKSAAIALFLAYVSSQSLEWGKSGQIPARLTVQRSPEFQSLPSMKALSAGADTIVFPDMFPKYGDATGPIWEALNEALVGKKSVPDAFAGAVKKSDSFLSE